jgi:PAS domain S-box-containing protein
MLLLHAVAERFIRDDAPMLLLMPAVFIAAHVGGLGPGLLATVLSVLAGGYLILDPSVAADQARIILFGLIGVLISLLSEKALRLQRQQRAVLAEREAGEQSLRESQESMQTVFDGTYDAIVIHTADGRILDVNETFLRMHGMTREQALRLSIADLSSPSESMDVALSIWARVMADEPQLFEWTGKRFHDGADFIVEIFLRRLRMRGQDVVLANLRDITRRKQTEAAERRRSASLKLLADSATRLMLEDRPERIVKGLYDELAAHLGLDVWFNFMVTEDGERLRLNGCAGINEETSRQVQYLDFGVAVCGMVAQRAERMVVEDVQQSADPQTELIRSLGICAYACHPLMARGKLIGTLSFGARNRDRFSGEELDFLQAACDQIAMALERRRLMDELAAAKLSAERARAEAEEASRAKDHFLAVLSHELRTPLTPVLASVWMLQTDGGRFDADTREHLEMIRRNVELEARLIDDLLDMTRIARGKVELERRPVEVCEVIRRAVEVCRPDIEARGLCFGVQIGSCAPYMVEADMARLQQVFWNLLKNAIKFTPDGGRIAIRCRNNKDAHVVVEVEDSGAGIEPAALSRIFNAFEQAGPAIMRQFGGLGLGLAISRTLVELHGGTIEAHSDGKGRGAIFRVRLPLMSADATKGRGESGGQVEKETMGYRDIETNGRASLRILLVEDHADTARMMSRLLAAGGHEVEIAGTVAAALDMAGSGSFDLLLSDLGLPDASGHDLLRMLRQRGVSLPAIALSGYGLEEDLRRSDAAGFAAHLTKPINLQRLHETIERVAGNGAAAGH